MANILALNNFIRSNGTEYLMVGYGNDIGVYDGSATFVGQGRNLNASRGEMDVFQDYLFYVNGVSQNLVYDGTTWFTGGARTRMPIANYVKTVGNRAYLADLTYVSTNFRSRVWFSDLPKNNDITWGYETGTNLAQTAGSKVVTSAFAGFKAYNIKTGDPFFITNGANAGEYIVDTVDSDQQITLVEEMKNSATGSTYWVGSNWFDPRTNDGDFVRGLGENSNKLLVFKRESLYRYDEKEVKKVKGVPGTTSNRSIVNINDNTYYFHETGVYRYDGVTSFLISRPIQDWIDGISMSNFNNVVGWADDEILYMFVGDITNSDRSISITNGLLIYDTAAQAWNIGRLDNVITVAAKTVSLSERQIFLGTSNDKVLIWGGSSTADISAPIEFNLATVYHFPAEAQNVVEFSKAEVYTLDGRGLSVYYKLYGTNSIDNNWRPLGDINDDVTLLNFPRGTFGRGIAYQIQEISTRRPVVLGRIDTYYKDREARNLPDVSNQ